MSNIQIILEPNYVTNPPKADIYINDIKHAVCKFGATDESIEHNLVLDLQNKNTIRIHRYGKTNQDTIMVGDELYVDQSLHIRNIIIDRVPLEKILQIGIFYPDYPEPWATQQREQGIELPKSETWRSSIYHNGNCHLDFNMPIHPWFFANLNISI